MSAGHELDRVRREGRQALVQAGIEPAEIYLTNAVKHFKWIERGKRRIHERPNRAEILACRAWLEDALSRNRSLAEFVRDLRAVAEQGLALKS